MLKAFIFSSGLLLAGLVIYLPFELAECARLVEQHGPKFFCVPITFFAIPLATLVLGLLLIAGWLRRAKADQSLIFRASRRSE